MDSKQIMLVQRSWQEVASMSDHLGSLFYQRLFEIEPSLRPLFKSDLEAQSRKLTAMLAHVVASLDSFSSLVPAVQDLGRRHVAYGVRSEHYDKVGTALLWSLQRTLGDAFTLETREAWATAYRILAEVMRSAAARGDASSDAVAQKREGPQLRAGPCVERSCRPEAPAVRAR